MVHCVKKYYAIRIEFQEVGSTQIHSFVRIFIHQIFKIMRCCQTIDIIQSFLS